MITQVKATPCMLLSDSMANLDLQSLVNAAYTAKPNHNLVHTPFRKEYIATKSRLQNSIETPLDTKLKDDLTLDKLHTPLGEFVKPASLHAAVNIARNTQDANLAQQILALISIQMQRVTDFIKLIIESENNLGLKGTDQIQVKYPRNFDESEGVYPETVSMRTSDGHQFYYRVDKDFDSINSMIYKGNEDIINISHEIKAAKENFEQTAYSANPALTTQIEPSKQQEFSYQFFNGSSVSPGGDNIHEYLLEASVKPDHNSDVKLKYLYPEH